jgi:hypothetical protein
MAASFVLASSIRGLKAKKEGTVHSLVMFKNNNRFPQDLDKFDKPIYFADTRFVFCLWGKGHLPVLSESSVKSLVYIINEYILFGTHGCTLPGVNMHGNLIPVCRLNQVTHWMARPFSHWRVQTLH